MPVAAQHIDADADEVGPYSQSAQVDGFDGTSIIAGVDSAISEHEPLWATPRTDGIWPALRRTLLTVGPFVISDLVALTASALIAHGLLLWLGVEQMHRLAMTPLVFCPLLLVAHWLCGHYTEIWLHPVTEFRQLTLVTTIGIFAAAAGGIANWPVPLWCLAIWLPAVALLPLLRTVIRQYLATYRWWGYPTLLIGSGDGATELVNLLLEVPRSGLRPALLTDPGAACTNNKLPCVNDPKRCRELLNKHGIRHAVVCLPEYSSAGLLAVVDRYSGMVPHLLVLSDTSTLPSLWGAWRSNDRISGVELRNGLLVATLQVVKRAIDLVVAVLALIAALPLMAAAAVAIKLTDGGPVFFGHTRIGQAGNKFRAWKLRSMHVDSAVILEKHLAENPEARAEWDRDQKLRNDPRVTRVGAFLRASSLDELPQLWNVLRGEMSLVGPRPIVANEVEKYGDVFRLYMTVKPGVTGLWQVSGRNDVSYRDRVLLDQFYVRNWSLWLDVYILAKTVVALLQRGGAY